MSAVAAELLKLRHRPAAWVLLGLWLGLQLVFSIAIPYLSVRRGAALEGTPPEELLRLLLPDRLVENTVSGLPLFGGGLLLTLGALVAGAEHTAGTLSTLLVQGRGRAVVLPAQLAALALALVLTLLVAFALTAAAAAGIAAAESAPADWPGAGDLLTGFGAGLLVALTWIAIGYLLGTALRGTALPIALGLVWVLAVESLVVNVAAPLLGFFDAVARGLPGVNAGSLVAALAGPGGPPDTPGVAATVPGGQAAGVLLVFLAGAVLVSAALIRRRDVT